MISPINYLWTSERQLENIHNFVGKTVALSLGRGNSGTGASLIAFSVSTRPTKLIEKADALVNQ